MSKTRTPIPQHTATEALYNSDRTCCVCNERGKTTQIHHIDENPSNNELENLAILCLECHDKTQITGGFGRKLNSDLVIKHRNEWLLRVQNRRDEADRIAISKTTGSSYDQKEIETLQYSEEREKAILEYIYALPTLRRELINNAEKEWDSGVTARMVDASYNYIDALEAILVRLAKFYPAGNFATTDIHEFFSEQISLRFSWHRNLAEPYGPGTGGTIVNIIVTGNVVSDVEKMVEDMALSLVGYNEDFNREEWSKLWNE